MSFNGKVQLINRKQLKDNRGWFLKILHGKEEHLNQKLGEIYVTRAVPGGFRANHYHRLASEWFSVIEGTAIVIVENIHTKERQEFTLSGENPQTLYCAPEIAHVFYNPKDSEKDFVLIAYADQQYDAADTIPYPLI